MSPDAESLIARHGGQKADAPAVWLGAEGLQVVSSQLIADLSAVAAERGRARMLLHRDRGDPLQQMVIALRGRAYIRPHLNDRGFKSWHVLRGQLLFCVFAKDGRLRDSSVLGADSAAAVRLNEPVYHTLVPLSDVAVYIETCSGPFLGTTYADWAPAEASAEVGDAWVERLLEEAAVTDG